MPTDEYGRDDPAALERERRRREREARRQGRKPKPKPEAAPAKAEQQPPPPRRLGRPPAGSPPVGSPPAGRGAGGREPPTLRRASGGGGGRSPRRRPRRANYRARRIAALALAGAGILVAWFLIAFFQPFAGEGLGTDSVAVEIPEGSDAGEIARILEREGVVSSARMFEWRLRLAGKADEIQADTYNLANDMSYGAAIDRLTGEEAGGTLTVTIPEGLDRRQIAADILPEGVSSDEYLQLTETAPQGFNPRQYGAKNRDLEGFLFPATYELQPGQGAAELVQQQLQAFEQNVGRVNMRRAKRANLTVYDVLTIASMIDKEVQVAEERPLVSAVIQNRLRQGIPLGIDATTRYETQNYTEQIPQSDLDKDTPYNTRLNAGLPPTPIGNPGLEAIEAAAAPANVDYLYFVVKPGTCGEHSFTASEQEFEQLAAEYRRALEEEGGSPTECPEE